LSRCSCRGGGAGAALTRLSQIITAPAANNTTAMTNQIMVRPSRRRRSPSRLQTPSRQLYQTVVVENLIWPAAACHVPGLRVGRAGIAVVDKTGG
jgi:hypothetical protein